MEFYIGLTRLGFKIVDIVVILLFLWIIYLMIKRVFVNKKNDEKLGIKTTGTRSWGRGSLYNRTESTPYLALKSLSEKYTMNSGDNLVDFGSGKGRVAIYLHDKYGIPVTGIELNDLTYNEAIENVNSYVDKKGSSKYEVRIEKEYAEKYKIKPNENKFFFFNPFDVSIFEKVVKNIIDNAIENNKEVEIILYYPLSSYQDYLTQKTPFKLHEEISASGSIGFREKFLVYKFNPSLIKNM